MSVALEITLDNVPHEVGNDLDNVSLMFLKRYREDFNLLGRQLWDREFTDHITSELLFSSLIKYIFQ